MIVGELACRNLRDRSDTLLAIDALPLATAATDQEVRQFIDRYQLWGTRVGWVDVHLIASALLSHARLWTLDRHMRRAAAGAGVRIYQPSNEAARL